MRECLQILDSGCPTLLCLLHLPNTLYPCQVVCRLPCKFPGTDLALKQKVKLKCASPEHFRNPEPGAHERKSSYAEPDKADLGSEVSSICVVDVWRDSAEDQIVDRSNCPRNTLGLGT
jgi:hypothetical protein